MPTLHWIGKEKVINHHLDVPFRVLEHKYGFTEVGETSAETKSGNKIIHGDNLEALKALLPEYEGRIKCIYIDPPYNTGNENWVYNDNVNDPKIRKWLGEVVGKESEDLSRHDKWLCMMYPRLVLLRRLLSQDGVIFISLDEIENSHLRPLMNEIFGDKHFIAQLILLCNPKGRSQDKYFSTNHEYITVFSKSLRPKDSFSIIKDDSLIDREYKLADNKGKFRLLDLRNTHREFNKVSRPNLFYPLFVDALDNSVSLSKNDSHCIEVTPVWPDGFEGCWTWGKELAHKDRNLLVAKYSKSKWRIFRKSYAESVDGEKASKKLFSILQDPKFYTEKGQITFGELFPGFTKNDFPQPKSVDLVQVLLQTATANNDIILDSFAGSGTTAHAILNLNKEDGGNRKFILIEKENYVESITSERVKRVITGYGEIKGAESMFDYYELGESLFLGDNNEFINENIELEKIRQYIWHSETRALYQRVESKIDNEWLLGINEGTAYYFIYDHNQIKTVDFETLPLLCAKAEQYVIYADNCLLPKDFMMKRNIIFKKIPRDITRF